MQVPSSNLRPNLLHHYVGDCRTEVDEETFLCDSSISAAETCSQENRTSRLDTSFAGHHPCNRRSSSSPDEAPAHTLVNAPLWLPEPPGLPLPFCNARWHHRRNAQTATADTASPSI